MSTGAPARDAVTVAEAVRVLLPAGRLAAAPQGLTHRVTWATSLRSRPPAFEPHGGGELVLTGGATLESLRQVDGSLGLVRILEGLSGAGAAGLCVAAPVSGPPPKWPTPSACPDRAAGRDVARWSPSGGSSGSCSVATTSCRRRRATSTAAWPSWRWS